MPKLDRRRIHEILADVARGAPLAGLMKKHGFTRADIRFWQAIHGMPFFEPRPTDAQIASLRAWRKEATRARAWSRYRRAAEALEGSEVSAFDGPRVDPHEHFGIRGWVDARSLIVCEKSSLASTLDEWTGAHPSFSFVHRASLASTPWLPSREAVETVVSHARRARVPLAYFGDLDPQSLHLFATLRAGGRHEFLLSGRRRHRVAYLGLDSSWLDWVFRREGGFLPFAIRMRHADREYWELVQRLVPDVRALIGEHASAFLDSGSKIEIDGILVKHREAFLSEMGKRLRKLTARR